MRQDIRVEIYGQVYRLRGELDPAYVEQLARTVEAKMQALAQESDSVDTRRLAVLAALNLADELHQLREKLQQEPSGLPGEFATRVEQCARRLEAALAGRSPG